MRRVSNRKNARRPERPAVVQNSGGEPPKKHFLDWCTFGAAVLAGIAATFAAVFTGQQAGIARDTEKRQLRAYVGVEFPDKFCKVDADTVEILAIAKNFGLTPAYEVRQMTALSVRSQPLPPGTNPPTQTSSNLAFVTAYPQSPEVFSQKLPKAAIAEAFTDKTKQLYFAGTVTYLDAFGESRYTHFCISVSLYGATEGVQQFGLQRCPEFNDSN